MAAYIASGLTETDGSDFTVLAGTPVTLFLIDADGPYLPQGARALVQIKSAGSQYYTIGELSHAQPITVLDAPGTFRVKRLACTESFGVDKS